MSVTYRSASIAGAASGNVTITKPAGVADGDLLTAVCFADPDGAAVTAPAGWTQIGSTYSPASIGFGSAYRKVASGEGTSYVFTGSGASTNQVMMMASFGHDTTTPYDVVPTWNSGAASLSHVAPSISPAGSDSFLVCAFYVLVQGSGGAYTPPASMTERVDAAAGSWIATCLDTQTLSASGATGTRTATCTDNRTFIGMSLAIKSATVGGPIVGNLGIPSDSSSGLTIKRVKRITLGIPSESDTAQSTTRAKLRTVGLPSETDTAFTITRLKAKTLGQPAETDTSLAVTRRHSRTLGIPSETDTGQTVGKKKYKTLGIPSEQDTPLGYGHTIFSGIGLPTESDSALPMGRLKRRTLGIPSDTSSAFSLAHIKRIALGLPDEFDAALPYFFPSQGIIVPDLTVRTGASATTVTTATESLTVRTGQAETIATGLQIITVRTS